MTAYLIRGIMRREVGALVGCYLTDGRHLLILSTYWGVRVGEVRIRVMWSLKH